jgi:nitroreductase
MHRDSGEKIPELEEIEAVACAMQNLMLSAAAAGVGSYWSSPPVLGTSEFRHWLGLREQDRCLGLMYVGWPRPNAASLTSVRAGLDACVTWA